MNDLDIREIKAKLALLGVTQTQIAKELNMTRATVNKVIHGKVKSKRVAEYLMEKYGIDVSTLVDKDFG